MRDQAHAMFDAVEWSAVERSDPVSDHLPYATHQGALSMLGTTFRCYRLNDGRCVVDASDVDKFLRLLGGQE